MQYLEIPMSIWLNALLLAAFALVIWFRPTATSAARKAKQPTVSSGPKGVLGKSG